MTDEELARDLRYAAERRALIVAAQGKYCPFHGDQLHMMSLTCEGCYYAGMWEKMHPEWAEELNLQRKEIEEGK